MQNMEFKKVEQMILNELEVLVDKVENGEYIVDYYVDNYYSGLSDLSVREILDGYDSLEELYDALIEGFYLYGGGNSEITKEIHCKLKEKYPNLIIDTDLLFDVVDENIRVNPVVNLSKKEVRINAVADFGDVNYDFTLNNYDTIVSEDAYNKSSLLKLVEILGFSKDKFLRYLQTDDFDEELTDEELAFFEDAYHEILNTTTSMNALTFFIKVNLEEYLD